MFTSLADSRHRQLPDVFRIYIVPYRQLKLVVDMGHLSDLSPKLKTLLGKAFPQEDGRLLHDHCSCALQERVEGAVFGSDGKDTTVKACEVIARLDAVLDVSDELGQSWHLG